MLAGGDCKYHLVITTPNLRVIKVKLKLQNPKLSKPNWMPSGACTLYAVAPGIGMAKP